MKVTISKKGIRSLFLVICAILMEHLFYLVDSDNIEFLGFIKYSYIWVFIYVIIVGYIYLMHRQWEKKVSYHFGVEIAFLAVLSLTQSLRGHITFDQPLIDGIIGQGRFLLVILGYYPIHKLYVDDIIDDKIFDKCLVFFGIVAFTIYLLQIMVGESHMFLHVYSNERYGSLRLYTDSVFCVFLGFYGMNRFLRTKKWKGLILVALTVVYELFIAKGRLEFAAFCVAIAIGLFLMKKHRTKKALAIVIVFCVIFAFLSNPYVNEIVTGVIDDFINNSGTMRIRESGREFYFAQLLSSVDSLIFGCGFPRTEESYDMAGGSRRIAIGDNGIFSFAYVYGIIGIIAVILWFAKMLRMAWRLYKEQNEYIYLMFVIFNIALMYNIAWWWWQYHWTFITVIMMCKMEHYLYDPNKKSYAGCLARTYEYDYELRFKVTGRLIR